MSSIKKIPKFKNEDEERTFWATHDSTEYINWKKAKKVMLSNLKPSIKSIPLVLPESIKIEELKLLANKKRCSISVVVKDISC